MADDIVTRLEQEHWCDADNCNLAQIAADEIERLRSQNTELIKMFKQVGVVADMWQKSEDELIELHHGKCAEQFAKQADEIERLRTLLDNTLERENKHNARQLDIVRKVESDRNRWRATAEMLARELGKVEYADAEWHNQEGLH